MKLFLLKVLSEEEIKQIHDASIDILEQVGIKVLGHRMLNFLKEKGIEVDEEMG